MNDKVFLVVEEWCCDGDDGRLNKVFSTHEKALDWFNEVKRDIKIDGDEWGYDTEDSSEDYYSVSLEGEWSTNHIQVYIETMVVQ